MEVQEIVDKKQLTEKAVEDMLILLMKDTGQDIKEVEINCWSYTVRDKEFRATVKITMGI